MKKPAKKSKKTVKKAAKKPAKKPAKKAAKKTAKKAVALKKPAPKKNAAKKPAPKKTMKAAVKKILRLLRPKEAPPARIENPKGRASCLIVCDHASNVIPLSLKDLGVSKADRQKHIAWDPGTEDIGRYLSKKLDAPAVFASYSRLVVDLNRGHDDIECMREIYDHIEVPGNKNLSDEQRAQRLDELFWPYHETIDAELRRFLSNGRVPMLLSIHSFTPEMDGFKRPWEIGILWNEEEGIARQLAENLRAQNPGMVVGENEPYSLKAYNKNTINTHAEARGLPYVIVEFRQDLVGTKTGAEKWAKIFLEALQPILDDVGTYRLRDERQ